MQPVKPSRKIEAAGSGLRLHLGCGPVTPVGWVNVDYFIGARLARLPLLGRMLRRLTATDWSTGILIHDLRRPLPWADRSAAAIYSGHTLEHLTREEGRRFLAECRRVLRPGGVLRIAVPDLRAIVDAYTKGHVPAVEFLDRLGVGTEVPGEARWKRRLAPFVRFPHRCMYDAEGLRAALWEAGFDARPHPPFVSRLPDVRELENASRAEESLIFEACVAPDAGARRDASVETEA
jgi:SAM-dependent methyltransferase